MGGLQGVATDIHRMSTELLARGFACQPLVGDVATRPAIMEALATLRDATGEHDAVVIYYTGHGGRCYVADGPGLRPSWSYLVPVGHSFQASFQGIAGFELSAIVREISVRTPNVTVILDCCHSSQMCRGGATRGAEWTYGPLEPETRGPRPLTAMSPAIAASVAALDEKCPSQVESNPLVVRVVATGSSSLALEARERETTGSLLTRFLVEALAQSRKHEPRSWDTIIRWVREQVIGVNRSSMQRSEVEGPRERLPFSLRVAGDLRSRLTVVRAFDGTTCVDGGSLHGLAAGDVLHILETETKVAAEVEVDEVFHGHATVRIRGQHEAKPALVPGSVAVRRTFGRRRPVSLDAGARGLARLSQRVACAPWLSLAVGERDEALHVVLDTAGLHVRGFHRRPVPTTDQGIEALVEDLQALARADVLCEALLRSPGLGLDAGSPTSLVAMVRLPGAEARPLVEGEVLCTGDEVYVDACRTERGGPLHYVNVIEKDVSGRVELVNRSEPAGVQVADQEQRLIGERMGKPPGLPTGWPSVVDERLLPVGQEELIVVVSLRPLDLRPLLEDYPPSPPRRDLPAMPSPGSRPASELGPLWWDVRRFRFDLRPNPR